MKHEVYVSFFEITKDGKLVLRQRKKANSYVVAYNQMTECMLAGSTVSIKDVGNASRSCNGSNGSVYCSLNALVNDATFGIVVGSDATAVTINDYKLGTLIANGATSGLLQYGATTIVPPAVVGSYSSWFLARPFLNNSGGTITIYETGVYLKNVASTWYFCIERNIPVVPYACLTSLGFVVQYEFRTTV
jgi:hypothetical protein